MTNLDTINKKYAEVAKKLVDAAKGDDSIVFEKAFVDFANGIQEQVMQEAKELAGVNDANILAARGVRQLTSEESTYFQKLATAMRSTDVKKALTEIDVTLPVTTIDAVFDDLVAQHPLLSAITFQNTSGLIEFLVNTNGNQMATWSPLCAKIVEELTSGFKKIEMSQNKLSAFMPVCKAMLDLGPAWLDRYVRTVLQEALYLGLEEGIINGNGINMPIGMKRNLAGPIDPTTGYPVKATVAVTALDPVTYGTLIAGMSKNDNGKARVISNVILVVNPTDYLMKVMPATTIRNTSGQYVNNVLPFPTDIVQSTQVPEGKAILGIPGRYFMGIGTAKSGKIEYSDEYRFLEDERVYLIKLYGHGEPLDNNAFQYLDISGLKPLTLQVEVVSETTNL